MLTGGYGTPMVLPRYFCIKQPRPALMWVVEGERYVFGVEKNRLARMFAEGHGTATVLL